MLWFFLALLNPVLHGAANILDNYIANKLFKNLSVLIFYSAFFDLAFLPLVWLGGLPQVPPLTSLPIFVLLGITNVAYLYPYYQALKHDDTSTVSSLFSLGKIFVPFLAFLIVGEVLEIKQYIGFFIIIFAATLLTFKKRGRTFNRSLLYMTVCSFILSLEIVLYKYIFTTIDWVTGFTWGSISSFVLIMLMFIWPPLRANIIQAFGQFKKVALLFGSEELLTFGGSAVATLALSLAPVTSVEGIGSLQPFFVLVYAVILRKFFPHIFREEITRGSIIKKVILFSLMLLGIILIAQ